MSESTQESGVMTDDGTGPVGAGAVLTAAREACGMSIEDAAGALRLGKDQLLALESGDTASLPDPTFVRGFIRNYSRLLKIDAEPLLQAYRSATPYAPHSLTLQSENIVIVGRESKAWRPYVFGALALLAGWAGWALYMDYREDAAARPAPVVASRQEPKQATPSAPPAGGLETAPMSVAEVTPEAVLAPEPVVQAPAASAAPVAPTPAVAPLAPAVPALPAGTSARLNLEFSEQVWMSVVDRTGKVVYENTAFPGDTKLIEGSPPLKLVVGNAAGVRMTFNGKAVDIAPHTRDNVARFTLE